eukprot:scaffold3992_cov137-Isochrysis_galbana.AAC.1
MVGPGWLAPHRLYAFARFLTPPKGVWECGKAPAQWSTSLGTRGVGSLVNRSRKISIVLPRPVSRAWFSPSFKRCSRPCTCTPPVRLSSVYSVHVQTPIRLRFDNALRHLRTS